MKIFIMIMLASFGCSNSNGISKKVDELRTLKTKYKTLTTEIDQKGKSLDRDVLNEKQKSAVLIESRIQTIEKEIDAVELKMVYDKKFTKLSTIPNFKIKNITQLDDKLEVNVTYSGGCGDPHEFELISNGSIDGNGVVDFYLEDKTKGDNCKMLLMRTKHFDISKINKKTKISGFRINDSVVKTFARSN